MSTTSSRSSKPTVADDTVEAKKGCGEWLPGKRKKEDRRWRGTLDGSFEVSPGEALTADLFRLSVDGNGVLDLVHVLHNVIEGRELPE